MLMHWFEVYVSAVRTWSYRNGTRDSPGLSSFTLVSSAFTNSGVFAARLVCSGVNRDLETRSRSRRASGGGFWCQSRRRRRILTFFSYPRFSSLVLLAAQSRAYTLLQRHPHTHTHTRTWCWVHPGVVDDLIHGLTFQIHFNQVENCYPVLLNLGQRQLLLCCRDSNTHCRTRTQTRHGGKLVAQLTADALSLRSCRMASEHVLMKIWASWSIWSRSLSVMRVRSEEKRLEGRPEASG